jgi:hypothetical protein
LQSSVDPEDRWVKLPFAEAEAMAPQDLRLDELIESVIEFELDQGATVIIPPYFYATSPADPWFHLTVRSIQRTAGYLQKAAIQLPLSPVLCAQLQSFSAQTTWDVGLDRFAAAALDAGASSMAICLSPAGAGTDGYGKVMRLFQAAERSKEHGLPVVAWRQGIYGPALIAAGLDGYECGLGTGEQTDIARHASAAATLAAQANRVLATEGINQQIKVRNLDALAQVVRHLANEQPGSRIA